MTTAEAVQSLLSYADFANDSIFEHRAIEQAEWLLTLQGVDGAFPRNVSANGRPVEPSVFATGRILAALLAIADRSPDNRWLDACARAGRWLTFHVNPQFGVWTRFTCIRNYSPAYYTRVCEPMLEIARRSSDSAIGSAAVRVLHTIASLQNENGTIRDWAHQPDEPAFTPTIAGTILGFVECSAGLGHDGRRFGDIAYTAADALRRRFEFHGKLAGSYDEQWQGTDWYASLEGNCGTATVWMRLYERTTDLRFLSAALKSLQFVIDRQCIAPRDPNLDGAIAGSSPVYGRYQALRYPGTAAASFVDATIRAHNNLAALLENGPCESL